MKGTAERLVECSLLLARQLRINAELRADVEELTEANRRLRDDLAARTWERDAYSAVVDRRAVFEDADLHRWIS